MSDDKIKCSFCGKTSDQVKRLIAGPDAYICNECVDLCESILEEELKDSEDSNFELELKTPKEIKKSVGFICYKTRSSQEILGCCCI